MPRTPARLIAAAPDPDLLAACERFVHEFPEEYCECRKTTEARGREPSALAEGDQPCDYCFARAAIARAKGEQPPRHETEE